MTAVFYGLCMFVSLFFFFWFKISRRMVLEHEEWASEEPSFLFSKEELWKLCKNKLAHAIWKDSRKKSAYHQQTPKKYKNVRYY